MNHLSVAIADDNQKILDLLEKVIGTDQELDLVGKGTVTIRDDTWNRIRLVNKEHERVTQYVRRNFE